MKTQNTIITDKANISKSSVFNLTALTLPYSDVIPVKPDGSFDGTTQNTILKYLSGSITRNEHDAFKENNQDEETSIIVKIYDIILGICEDNWIESLDEGFIDEVTDLWLMCNRENFQNNEEFPYKLQKLIFMIYAKLETPKLRHIALEFHKQYKDDVQINSLVENNELFLINLPEHRDYNAKYGIKDCNF